MASADVVISEIMYDLPGADSKAEWIELYNDGSDAVDVSKWKLNDGSNHSLNAPPKNGSSGSLILQPGAYLILASDASTFRSSYTVSSSVIDTVMSLGNENGSVTLLNASSSLMDTVSYSKATGAAGNGESLQKAGGSFLPAKPSPGDANSSERIAKPAAEPQKISKAAAKAPVQGKIDTAAASTSRKPAATPEPEVAALAAAAVVPVGGEGGSMMSWAYGALAAGAAGAAAVFVTRQKKSGEWEIEEIA